MTEAEPPWGRGAYTDARRIPSRRIDIAVSRRRNSRDPRSERRRQIGSAGNHSGLSSRRQRAHFHRRPRRDGVAPERRNVGFVVQNFGLFPHLYVAANVAIARRDRPARHQQQLCRAAATERAACAISALRIWRSARPEDLSPGEKQRVALARALAGGPDCSCSTSPSQRSIARPDDQLRGELKSFLRKLSLPAIFVTHDLPTRSRLPTGSWCCVRAG